MYGMAITKFLVAATSFTALSFALAGSAGGQQYNTLHWKNGDTPCIPGQFGFIGSDMVALCTGTTERVVSTLDLNRCFANDDGQITPSLGGGFNSTCLNISLDETTGFLRANCTRRDASLPPIENNHDMLTVLHEYERGILKCTAAPTAEGGEVEESDEDRIGCPLTTQNEDQCEYTCQNAVDWAGLDPKEFKLSDCDFGI